MVTYTTTDLLAAIKRVSHVPVADETFLNPALLALSDTEMRTFLSPKLAAVRENYWVTYKDCDLPSASEVNIVEIPSLSLGGGIIDAKLLVSENFLPLDRIEVSELTSTQFAPRPIYGYWIEDNLIKVLPNGGITGTMRVWYQRMPSKLVPTNQCAQVDSISGNDITVVSIPATFTLTTELDIVSAVPGFNVIKKDSAPTAINNLIITFDDVPSRVKVGDWICLSGESCVVQAPIEWVELLPQAVAVKIYEIQGYLTKRDKAKETLKGMVDQVLSIVNPRQVEKTKYITAGGGVLNAGSQRQYLVGRRQ